MKNLHSICLVIIAVVTTAFTLIYTKQIMVPFVLSLLIAFLLSPIVSLFENKFRLPRTLSLLLTILLGLGVLSLISFTLIGTITSALENVSVYEKNIQQLIKKILGIMESWNVSEYTISKDKIIESVKNLPLLGFLNSATGAILNFVSDFFLILIFVLFLLSGRSFGLKTSHTFKRIEKNINSYLVTKLLTSLATGLLTGITLSIIGLDLAVMFGFFAFILNFIPTVGSILSVLLPLPVALLQFTTATPIALIFIFPIVYQIIIGNIIEPKIVGNSLDLHPVTALLALMFWGLIWGVPGMFLAMPLTVIMKIILEQYEETKVITELMAGRLGKA